MFYTKTPLSIFVLVLLYLKLPQQGVNGAVHTYNQQYFQAVGEHAWIFRGGREGLYKSKNTQDVVENDELLFEEFFMYGYYDWSTQILAPGVANGESYVKFEGLQFTRPDLLAQKYKDKMYDVTGTVEIVLFEIQDISSIGIITSTGSKIFCCTEELSKEVDCEPQRLIYTPRESDPTWPYIQQLQFYGNQTTAQVPNHEGVVITRTGMYYLQFFACGHDLAGLQISGQTIWKNPFGYLPGMMSPNLKFFGVMSLLYLFLAVVWMGFCLMNWRDLITLQHCVSLVIALDMMETSTWYFDYVTFNQSGYRPQETTLWAVILGCIRKTLSRILVLLVAMGYGTVRPTLGGLSKRVLAVGIGYLIAIIAYDLYFNVGQIDDLEGWMRIALVLPASLLDAVFILWIFTSLAKTLTQLQAKNQAAKLALYRKFTNVLAVTVWIAVMWLVYELWFRFSDPNNEKWRYEWLCNAFWYILNFVFILIICILWAPSQNATRYAYSEFEGDLFAQETRKPQAPVKTDVFSIDVDEETATTKKD